MIAKTAIAGVVGETDFKHPRDDPIGAVLLDLQDRIACRSSIKTMLMSLTVV